MTRRLCNYIDVLVCVYFAELYVILYTIIADAFCAISYTIITNGIWWSDTKILQMHLVGNSKILQMHLVGKYVAIADEVL